MPKTAVKPRKTRPNSKHKAIPQPKRAFRITGITEPQQASLNEALIHGSTLVAWCKDNGVNSMRIYESLRNNSEFRREYTYARECQGTTLADRILEVIYKCEQGLLDPNAARVCIQGFQWLATKLNPKSYGERTTLDVNIDAKHTLVDYLQAQVIDVTPRRPALDTDED